MTRSEIVQMFRDECPEITSRVITDATLYNWCLVGDKRFCAETRCIVDKEGTTITTAADEDNWDLESKITNFYDIDDFPGSGVLYNGVRLTKCTMAELDTDSKKWRSRDSGTPKKWFRRGKYLYVDRPVDSNAYDITVYSVLVSDDWNADVAPFNQLGYLEPFHEGMVLYLKMRAKAKIEKPEDAERAAGEYVGYVQWVKRQLGGNKYGPIYYRRSNPPNWGTNR